MKIHRLAVVAAVALSALALNSCETATGTGALVGAGTGALIGAAIDADQRGYYEGHEAGYYSYGRRTGRPGIVRSPYPPHSLVDVRGIPRGALVRDPATGRPFRKP
ncbi:MAG TPA: hypothetical protein VK474_06890 [Chthoniobacterales bacterium]|nr:hypothetical protein [Chthoniobacterales bacterium]